MKLTQTDRPRMLFLFSDTGGGHRSATEAVIEAINIEYGDQFQMEMIDIFKDYAPRPLNYMPDLYPKMVQVPQAWAIGYRLSNGYRRSRMLTDFTWPYVRRSIRRLVAQHPSELIVSVHPLATGPTLMALGKNRRARFITLVTDLVTTHAFWYHSDTDMCIVPTEAAGERALRFGLKPEQIQVIGLPVADRFCKPPGDKNTIRARLGWTQDRPVVLLVGGGDGMGPLERTARAIADARLPTTLAVITGRNERLKTRLESQAWPIPTRIYGFVREMPDFMRAADVLVTKAGPGTISEALNAGLPLILYSRLPGQEEGNVSYVVNEGAGVWAPEPEQIIAALQAWLKSPHQRQKAAGNALRLANPNAARQIAHVLAEGLDSLQMAPDSREKAGQFD